MGLRQRVINLASREQTNQNGTTQTAIVLYVRRRIGDDSYHKFGPRRFAEVHHLNIRVIVARLSTKPWIRVELGTFVGQLGDQEYELGSTEAGVGAGDSQDERAPAGDPGGSWPEVGGPRLRSGRPARCGGGRAPVTSRSALGHVALCGLGSRSYGVLDVLELGLP